MRLRFILSKLILFLLAAFLLSCSTSPIVVGKATELGMFTARGDDSKTWQLNKKQFEQVENWLTKYDLGLGNLLITPPHPTFSVVLRREDGSYSSIQLFSASDDWKRKIIINDKHIRSITPEDRERLLQIVLPSAEK